VMHFLCEPWRKKTSEKDIVIIVVACIREKLHSPRIFQTWRNS